MLFSEITIQAKLILLNVSSPKNGMKPDKYLTIHHNIKKL